MFLSFKFKSSIDNCLIEWDLAAGFFPHDKEPQEYHWPVDAQGHETSDSESFVEVCRRRVNEEESDDDAAVPEPRPKKGKKGASEGKGKDKRPHFQSSSSAAAEEPQVINIIIN